MHLHQNSFENQVWNICDLSDLAKPHLYEVIFSCSLLALNLFHNVTHKHLTQTVLFSSYLITILTRLLCYLKEIYISVVVAQHQWLNYFARSWVFWISKWILQVFFCIGTKSPNLLWWSMSLWLKSLSNILKNSWYFDAPLSGEMEKFPGEMFWKEIKMIDSRLKSEGTQGEHWQYHSLCK